MAERDRRDPERADPAPDAPIDSFLEAVYTELRALAAAQLRYERADHTLRPTALVHEAYLRLAACSDITLRGKSHFIALASSAMRRVLVDHARRHRAGKRGGTWQRVSFDDVPVMVEAPLGDVLDLDRALTRLETVDPRAVRIVELRFFGGMTEREIASMLGIAERTVRHEWAHCRAWLREQLARDGAIPAPRADRSPLESDDGGPGAAGEG